MPDPTVRELLAEGAGRRSASVPERPESDLHRTLRWWDFLEQLLPLPPTRVPGGPANRWFR